MRPSLAAEPLRLRGLAAVLVTAGGYTTWTYTNPTVLTATTEIDADADAVWAVLTDLSAYEHSFRIEEIGPGRVRVVQRETFKGVAVPFMRGMLRDQIEPSFEALNAALAERAEKLAEALA